MYPALSHALGNDVMLDLRGSDQPATVRSADEGDLHVAGFYPSLFLNIADNLRRLGAFDAAAEHISNAQEHTSALSDDAYGKSIRTAIREVQQAIENGDTARRASAPGAAQ